MFLPRLNRLRRVTATLVAMSLSLFTTEELIPDVHDGDATAAELAAAGVIPQQVGELPAPGDQPNLPPPDGADHSAHVCHCTHGHSGPVVKAELGLRLLAHAEPVPSAEPTRIPDVKLEPQVRPPIA